MGPKMADFSTYDNKYSCSIRDEEFLTDYPLGTKKELHICTYVSLYFISGDL
jgi:hypothetical protein